MLLGGVPDAPAGEGLRASGDLTRRPPEITVPTPLTRALAVILAGPTLGAAGLLSAPPASADSYAVPPARVVGITDGTLSGGAALGADGTIVQRRDPALRIYQPGVGGTNPEAKVITGLASSPSSVPSIDETHGVATVAGDEADARVVVIDPEQSAGDAEPLRTIAGATTMLELPIAVTWAADGALWVVDGMIDGEYDLELLRFAPGALGNVAPNRVIVGPATRLDDLQRAAIDVLPDGSVVVGAYGTNPNVLVFGPDQNGDVAPLRRFVPTAPGPAYFQTGVATDSRGRIYVPMAQLESENWGVIAVYGDGADLGATPELELTGPASSLHLVAFPSVAPDDRLLVTDFTGATGEFRLLEFGPLPYAPSAVRALRARASRTSVTFRWRPPADTGRVGIDRYAVVVRKGNRAVYRVSVSGTRHAVAVRRLPKGPLTVRVTAVNAAGAGPASTTAFRKRASALDGAS